MPYMMMRVEVTRCLQCDAEFGKDSASYAYAGLCGVCAGKAARDRRHRLRGTTPPKSRDEVLDEYRHGRDLGDSPAQVAVRLGMSRPAFERCMLRARKSGDPRAADWKGWSR